MKKEDKNPVGRPKGERKNISFWCNPKNKPLINKYIKDNKL